MHHFFNGSFYLNSVNRIRFGNVFLIWYRFESYFHHIWGINLKIKAVEWKQYKHNIHAYVCACALTIYLWNQLVVFSRRKPCQWHSWHYKQESNGWKASSLEWQPWSRVHGLTIRRIMQRELHWKQCCKLQTSWRWLHWSICSQLRCRATDFWHHNRTHCGLSKKVYRAIASVFWSSH